MAAQEGVIMSKWALWVLGFIVLAHLVFEAHSFFQCDDALPKVSQCIAFVLGGESKPNGECCKGLSDLAKMTAKDEDRKALCECSKQLVSAPIDFNKLNELPKFCAVAINFIISPDMDCNKV